MSKDEIKLKAFPFIEGEDVFLCPIQSEHAELYTKWANHPRGRRYSRFVVPITIENARQWAQSTDDIPKNIGFEIWYKKDNKPIGTCGIGDIDWINRTAFLFMNIGEPEYWNKHLGTQAGKLLLKYAFNELNLNRLVAKIYEPNIGSWKVAEKIGFTFEGIQKAAVYVDGKYYGAKAYGLLKEDWLKKGL